MIFTLLFTWSILYVLIIPDVVFTWINFFHFFVLTTSLTGIFIIIVFYLIFIFKRFNLLSIIITIFFIYLIINSSYFLFLTDSFEFYRLVANQRMPDNETIIPPLSTEFSFTPITKVIIFFAFLGAILFYTIVLADVDKRTKGK